MAFFTRKLLGSTHDFYIYINNSVFLNWIMANLLRAPIDEREVRSVTAVGFGSTVGYHRPRSLMVLNS
jgi:hypothetical protein